MATILVVDDDPLVANMIQKFVEAFGHTVKCAHDGVNAVRLALQHKPPLMFLDMDMPGANAFDILEELRRFSRTRHTQVVMMSESPDRYERANTLRRGATSFLTKPIQLPDLRLHVKAFAAEGAA